MSNKTTTTDKPADTDTPVQTWTEHKIRVVEARIARNGETLVNDLLTGIRGEFYKITGDKSAAAWVARVLPEGLSYKAPARKPVAVALAETGANIPTIAAAVQAGTGTVHRDLKEAGVTTVNGTKAPGGGRKAATPATKPETPATPAPKAETPTETPATPATVPDATPDVYGAVVSVLDRLSREELARLAGEIAARLAK